jgi:metal-responsive CopG/Arc/MetJ family transcriptional regulator
MSIYIDLYDLLMYFKIVMSTQKPRVLITFDAKLLTRIDDFRFGNRIASRSEAIRRLIEEALKKYEKKSK